MEFREDTFSHNIWGITDAQINHYTNKFVAATALSGLTWFKNNHRLIKDAYDLYQGFRQKKEMATGRRGRYRKSKRYRRRGFKRRRIGRRRSGLGRRVRAINRLLRTKGIRNAEIKYLDVATIASTPTEYENYEASRGPKFNLTLPIVQSDTKEGRAGAKIFVRKIKLYMSFFANQATTAGTDQLVRWIVVRDKHPSSPTSMPQMEELFIVSQAAGGVPTTAAMGWSSMHTFRYIDNRLAGRFSWLASGIVRLGRNIGSQGFSTVMLKKTIRVMQPTYFGNQESLVDADFGKGQIYLYAYSTEVGGNFPTGTVSYRVSYTDL